MKQPVEWKVRVFFLGGGLIFEIPNAPRVQCDFFLQWFEFMVSVGTSSSIKKNGVNDGSHL